MARPRVNHAGFILAISETRQMANWFRSPDTIS
jgi:hypothetical protein